MVYAYNTKSTNCGLVKNNYGGRNGKEVETVFIFGKAMSSKHSADKNKQVVEKIFYNDAYLSSGNVNSSSLFLAKNKLLLNSVNYESNVEILLKQLKRFFSHYFFLVSNRCLKLPASRNLGSVVKYLNPEFIF